MNRTGAFAVALALSAGASAQAPKPFDPVDFFTGPTQGRGTLKELLGKEKRTTTQSVGRIDKDGWLVLDQKVAVEGDPVRQRRWRLKQVSPGRYGGTLSDATGPVEAATVGRAIRIRYKMKGGLKVDELLTPLPGGRVVEDRSTFYKWGMKVATATGRIEKR